MTAPDQYASVGYLVTDVQTAIDFYTTHLGFTLNSRAASAFADVVRGPLRLLLSGPASSGARATPDEAATASTSSSTTSTPRSSGSGARACPSAATWSPAPADARSCSPTRTAT
jgi:catechol 2,3-dioxygenase-like lactoylglutathione lyase family enzyme